MNVHRGLTHPSIQPLNKINFLDKVTVIPLHLLVKCTFGGNSVEVILQSLENSKTVLLP